VSLVIGCPIRDRGWIIAPWLDHIATALDRAQISACDAKILLAASAEDPTIEVAVSHAQSVGLDVGHLTTEEGFEPYQRRWTPARFQLLARVRNSILVEVRRVRPVAFWSVDSDVLVGANSLKESLAAVARFDAVGSRCYMSPTTRRYPSGAVLTRQGRLARVDTDSLELVDVVMACVLMSPAAYSVDYHSHPLGEDVGWSLAARRHGCSLALQGRAPSKHVMRVRDLAAVDERCGF
jgi:hypothetical protein